MKKGNFDFGGWATRNDLVCADGRTIRRNAFKDDDGRTVPLVYQHDHKDPTRVIGHALLENRDEGVYAYCSLNNTNIGQHVKECVRHGDINSLSIFANKLTQRGGDVIHGTIRELSVVLAGANPGAVIEFPILEHGEESETEAYIWPGEEELFMMQGMDLGDKGEEDEDDSEPDKPQEDQNGSTESEEENLSHADEDKKDDSDETVQDVLNSLNEDQRSALDYVINLALSGEKFEASENGAEKTNKKKPEGKTVADVLKTLNEKQQKVAEHLIEQAQSIADSIKEDDEDDNKNDKDDGKAVSHSDDEGEEITMSRNLFESNGVMEQDNEQNNTLTHAQMEVIANDMKKLGSLRDAVLAHSAEYGIDQIDYLMPEFREFSGNGAPQFIKRDTTWVSKIMNGVHHTPFAKVKTTFADITADEARARGYIKGKRKKEEVFSLLKRETGPKTVYKKQKIDRDDAIDLSNGFDMVAWLKSEMRMMLDEELARAFIIGDGRSADSDDKIDEDKIRPVLKDDSLFVIRKGLEVAEGQARADALVDAVTYAWEDYQGTGNCVALMTSREHSGLKLLKDRMGHRIYKNDSEIASALGVREIIFVPQIGDDSTVREEGGKTFKPLVIILDLDDYNVGADRGGSVNMFDDFDIDYNQMKYLIETRCSGALVKPYSAIVIEEEVNP